MSGAGAIAVMGTFARSKLVERFVVNEIKEVASRGVNTDAVVDKDTGSVAGRAVFASGTEASPAGFIADGRRIHAFVIFIELRALGTGRAALSASLEAGLASGVAGEALVIDQNLIFLTGEAIVISGSGASLAALVARQAKRDVEQAGEHLDCIQTIQTLSTSAHSGSVATTIILAFVRTEFAQQLVEGIIPDVTVNGNAGSTLKL